MVPAQHSPNVAHAGHTGAPRRSRGLKNSPTSHLDQHESPALALLHIASQFVIDSGVDVRWDGATSAPAAEALRLLRFASKFRRHAPVDRTAHLMLMARAADELDSDAVWITHGPLLRHFIQRTIT